MRRTKIIAFLLVIVMLVSVLASCNGGSEETEETVSQDGPQLDQKWMDLNFGEDLIINVNVFNPSEQTFLNPSIYERGPESIAEATDTVTKMVYDRNVTIANALDLNIVWEETNATIIAGQTILEQFVKLSPDNSPDIYVSFIYDIIHSMLTGSLQNLYHNYGEENPQDGEVNYFDFDAEGWYTEYMKGTTMRQDKMYMMAGDYFVDIIRWSYVIYVNRTLFDELGIMGYNMDYLYADVIDKAWDYEWFAIFIEQAFQDANGDGVEDSKVDDSIGFISTPHMERAFTWTTGLSVVGWEGEAYNSKPYIIENNADMFAFAGEFDKLYNTPGVMRIDNILGAITLFLEDGVLFTLSMMGEMESESVRDSEVQKGLLPVPLYDKDKQDDYYTLVHDLANIGCILNNVRRFSAATAYMQLANETSVPILKEYYEKALKLKYTEDADDRAMIDLIHDRVVSPFDSIIARLIISGGAFLPEAPFSGTEIYNIVLYAADDTAGFQSSYATGSEGWKKNLIRMSEIFDELL